MRTTTARWLTAGLAAVGLGFAGVGTAAAAAPHGQTVTESTHQHGTWTEPGDTDFCTGATIAPTITGNEVAHITYFTGSDEYWATFTEEGWATYADPVTGLDWSGRVTVWGGDNLNERNGTSTFTASFTLSATDADGVVHQEVGHQVSHVTIDADGAPKIAFDRMWATCS